MDWALAIGQALVLSVLRVPSLVIFTQSGEGTCPSQANDLPEITWLVRHRALCPWCGPVAIEEHQSARTELEARVWQSKERARTLEPDNLGLNPDSTTYNCEVLGKSLNASGPLLPYL